MELLKNTLEQVKAQIERREVPTQLFEGEPLMTPSPESRLSELCPLCHGTGMEVVPEKGARRCECRLRVERERALALIPKEFGIPRLDSITPDAGRHPQQAEKFKWVRENPNLSYFIFGDNGTGKTFLGWALYVHAVEQGRKVVACELDTLLKGYRRYAFRVRDGEVVDDYRPPVLTEDLTNANRKWTIFLDEIGATTPTEYAAKEFFYLLKAAHEGGHQMVFTCNVSPQMLQKHWGRTDEFWGNSIARRIAEYSQQVNLFRYDAH